MNKVEYMGMFNIPVIRHFETIERAIQWVRQVGKLHSAKINGEYASLIS